MKKNKVTVGEIQNPTQNPEVGSYWRKHDDVFVLSNLGGGWYAAIRLSDGARWRNRADTMESAVVGLTPIPDGTKITVEVGE